MTRTSTLAITLLLMLSALGCSTETNGPITAERIDLSSVASDDERAVGVTYDEAGRVFVLTESGLIYALNGEELNLFHEVDPRVAPAGFTDITSVGDGKFALSSESDGFLLDVNTGSFEQHFCYLPGDLPGEEPDEENPVRPDLLAPGMIQTTYALTSSNGTIYAQPQTTPREDASNVLGAFFTTYDVESGADLMWTETYERRFQFIGGMAHLGGVGTESEQLLVASGDTLSIITLSGPDYDFESLGVLGIDAAVDVSGLAIDRANDQIIFIDAVSNELRILPLEETLARGRAAAADEVVGS